MNRIRLLLSTTLLALMLVLPAGAQAGTTFGDPFTGSIWGSTEYSMVQILNPDGSAFNGVPHDGVITSVTVRSSGSAGSVRATFLRPAGPIGLAYDLSKFAPDQTIAVTADVLPSSHETTVQTRVPAKQGDRVGLIAGAGGVSATSAYTQLPPPAAQNMCAFVFGADNQSIGGTTTYTVSSCNYNSPAVRAVVERDADLDGFGDDTQDACSTDATTQGSCKPANVTITAVKSKAKTRTSARRSFIVANTGGTVASGVVFSVKSSKAVKGLAIAAGCVPDPKKRLCTLAPLAPGASVVVSVKLKVMKATRTTLTATAGAVRATSTVKLKKKK